jgi:ABC-type amino acid transport substrate-binding protein
MKEEPFVMRKPEMPMAASTTDSPASIQQDTFQQRGWPSAANRFRYRDDNPTPYEGFCIDLLKEMAKLLNFTYEVVEVDDGAYGVEVSIFPLFFDFKF